MDEMPRKSSSAMRARIRNLPWHWVKAARSGVDAWVDVWEILPGDQLIDKIFNQGIGQAAVFLIVLSRDSVQKPWVSEELDAALVLRIEQKMKIIPVRIDDCEVPVALRATAWVNVDPHGDFATELTQDSFGHFRSHSKASPRRAAGDLSQEQPVGPYSLEETRILEFILKQHWEQTADYVSVEDFQKAFPDLAPSVVNDAIELMESEGIVKIHREMGSGEFDFGFLELRPAGWVKYATQMVGINVEQDLQQILAYVVSEGPVTGDQIAEGVELPSSRVNMAVDYLDGVGHVRCVRPWVLLRTRLRRSRRPQKAEKPQGVDATPLRRRTHACSSLDPALPVLLDRADGHTTVLWFDPEREYEALLPHLTGVTLWRYDGSLLRLRYRLIQRAAGEKTVVYLPMHQEDAEVLRPFFADQPALHRPALQVPPPPGAGLPGRSPGGPRAARPAAAAGRALRGQRPRVLDLQPGQPGARPRDAHRQLRRRAPALPGCARGRMGARARGAARRPLRRPTGEHLRPGCDG